MAPPGLLRVSIYVTSPSFVPGATPNTISTPAQVYSTSTSPPSLPLGPSSASPRAVPFGSASTSSPFPRIQGRPDLRAIVEAEIEATDYSDYFAVGTCGPTPMTKDLANIVSDAIQPAKVLRGEKRRNIVRRFNLFASDAWISANASLPRSSQRFHCEAFGW